MSCTPGKPCWEGFKRRRALGVLGLMGAIFILLSAFSFLDSRGQVIPSKVQYAGFDAVEGKRVFQAFNCMGCHTIVGNGAYFGPDLTKLYDKVGPAWIEAFLPSAGAWPASGAVNLKLLDKSIAAEAGVSSMEEYLEKYPAAAERINRRGGHASQMPNLPLNREQVGNLIAFLKYTSAMNTEGWPPKSKVDGLTFPQARQNPEQSTPGQSSGKPAEDPTAGDQPVSLAVLGGKLAAQNGCTACHSTSTQKLVGPGWQGLYGSQVSLADGSKVTADDSYLTRAILDPDSELVEGYTAGIMPTFAGLLDEQQVSAIVAYLRTLKGN